MCLSWNITIIRLESCASAPATDHAQPKRRKDAQRRGAGVQSGHQGGESNLQLDFIGSIQTLKDVSAEDGTGCGQKRQKKLPKTSEFQKQLENSVSGTENAGLVWLSLSQQTISRQTQVEINKLPN